MAITLKRKDNTIEQLHQVAVGSKSSVTTQQRDDVNKAKARLQKLVDNIPAKKVNHLTPQQEEAIVKYYKTLVAIQGAFQLAGISHEIYHGLAQDIRNMVADYPWLLRLENKKARKLSRDSVAVVDSREELHSADVAKIVINAIEHVESESVVKPAEEVVQMDASQPALLDDDVKAEPELVVSLSTLTDDEQHTEEEYVTQQSKSVEPMPIVLRDIPQSMPIATMPTHDVAATHHQALPPATAYLSINLFVFMSVLHTPEATYVTTVMAMAVTLETSQFTYSELAVAREDAVFVPMTALSPTTVPFIEEVEEIDSSVQGQPSPAFVPSIEFLEDMIEPMPVPVPSDDMRLEVLTEDEEQEEELVEEYEQEDDGKEYDMSAESDNTGYDIDVEEDDMTFVPQLEPKFEQGLEPALGMPVEQHPEYHPTPADGSYVDMNSEYDDSLAAQLEPQMPVSPHQPTMYDYDTPQPKPSFEVYDPYAAKESQWEKGSSLFAAPTPTPTFESDEALALKLQREYAREATEHFDNIGAHDIADSMWNVANAQSAEEMAKNDVFRQADSIQGYNSAGMFAPTLGKSHVDQSAALLEASSKQRNGVEHTNDDTQIILPTLA